MDSTKVSAAPKSAAMPGRFTILHHHQLQATHHLSKLRHIFLNVCHHSPRAPQHTKGVWPPAESIGLKYVNG